MQLGLDTKFRPEKSGFIFEVSALIGDGELWKAFSYVRSFKDFMTDTELLGTADRLVQKITPAVQDALAVLTLQGQAAGNRQKFLAGCFFDLAPQFIGAQDQGNVFLAFADRLSDDPTLTVGRAVIMRRRKPIEAQHFIAPFRQLVNRGASHGAETAYDGVELIDHYSTGARSKRSSRSIASLRSSRNTNVGSALLLALNTLLH